MRKDIGLENVNKDKYTSTTRNLILHMIRNNRKASVCHSACCRCTPSPLTPRYSACLPRGLLWLFPGSRAGYRIHEERPGRDPPRGSGTRCPTQGRVSRDEFCDRHQDSPRCGLLQFKPSQHFNLAPYQRPTNRRPTLMVRFLEKYNFPHHP